METERESEMIEALASVAAEVAETVKEVGTKLEEINARLDVPEGLDSAREKLEQSCGTKENPRYIITLNESLAGDRHPITGVEFVKKIVETPAGEYIEGVFAKFESNFNAEIPKELYLEGDKTQFKECNKQLYERLEKDPELKKQFSEEQIEQIKDGMKDGSAPDGYVWHHEAESGKISLVDAEIHARTGHTGGRSIWGGGSDNR